MQYRQGDVFLEKIDAIPDGAEEVARENGVVVLAHGEATGHFHGIRAKSATLFDKAGQRFLTVVARKVRLEHDEHSTINLPPGSYRVIRQRMYEPEGARNVAD